jgi:tryptophanyl-tRNA synthetase
MMDHGVSGYVPRFVSALESGSRIHLGTYFGNLNLCIESQIRNPRNNFLFIADLHFRADGLSEEDLQARNDELLREFIALGINPEYTVLYQQSDIPELFEILWFLGCHSSAHALLEQEDHRDASEPTIAQSLYPLLMAADVIGLRASTVTVGPDEDHRVKFAAKVADTINKTCTQPILPLPARDTRVEAYILGTDGERMATGRRNAIPIFGEHSEVLRAIDRIKTVRVRKKEPINPDTDVAFQLISLFVGMEQLQGIRDNYTNMDFDHEDAKSLLKKLFFEKFDPAKERLERLKTERDIAREILGAGRKRVRREMRETVQMLRDAFTDD